MLRRFLVGERIRCKHLPQKFACSPQRWGRLSFQHFHSTQRAGLVRVAGDFIRTNGPRGFWNSLEVETLGASRLKSKCTPDQNHAIVPSTTRTNYLYPVNSEWPNIEFEKEPPKHTLTQVGIPVYMGKGKDSRIRTQQDPSVFLRVGRAQRLNCNKCTEHLTEIGSLLPVRTSIVIVA